MNLLCGIACSDDSVTEIGRQVFVTPATICRHRVEGPAGAVVKDGFVDPGESVLDASQGWSVELAPTLRAPLAPPVGSLPGGFPHELKFRQMPQPLQLSGRLNDLWLGDNDRGCYVAEAGHVKVSARF